MGKRGPKPDPRVAERNQRIVERLRGGARLDDVAREYGLAERYIYRICRAATGLTPRELQGPRWGRERALNALRDWMERNGRPPTARDVRVARDLPAIDTIMRALDIRSWRQVYGLLGMETPRHKAQGIDTDVTRGPPTPDEIREARARLGMSQGVLAEALGVTPTQVSRWERGTRKAPPHLRLAIAFLERR